MEYLVSAVTLEKTRTRLLVHHLYLYAQTPEELLMVRPWVDAPASNRESNWSDPALPDKTTWLEGTTRNDMRHTLIFRILSLKPCCCRVYGLKFTLHNMQRLL